MSRPRPRSPVRLRLYAWLSGLLLGAADGALAVTLAAGAGGGAPASRPTAALAMVMIMCGAAALASAGGGRPARRFGGRMTGAVADLLIISGAVVIALVAGGAAGVERAGGAVLTGALGDGPGAVLAGAVLVGLGSGLLLLVAPQVCHELSLPGHRRLMPQALALVPVGAALGVLGAMWQARPVVGAWLCLAVVALVHQGAVLALPRSPVWLVGRGRDVEAFAALRGLHGTLEAAVAIDWARHEAGMAADQQPLTPADLRIGRIRRTACAAVVLVLAQEAPLGASAMILAPTIALGLGGAGGPVLAGAVGWIVVGLLALALGGIVTRRRFIAVALGVSLAAIASTLLLASAAAHGRAALWLTVIPLVVIVGAQHALVIPACQGAVDPRVPPWLVGAQRRMVAVGGSVVRIPALAVPLAVLERGGPEAMAWVFFALAVASAVVVMARLPRELGAP
ncbi:MFS transporter [Actinomyces bowdenii]|uniref:MFS transporter n=1 Tax=Actinomyces bowdenii TaxID=131109 RepID=UPI001ABD4145|nr:MFS transporter [Actinomyces bowdenii]MBO3724838.1 MFS transporter [Actinomyces bowdenii]